MTTVPATKPAWFDVYPEFDTRIAYECVREVDEVRTRIASIRDTISGLDEMAHKSGAGPWLDTYTRNCQHIWHWLGEVTQSLSRLAGNMEDAINQAASETYRKNLAWLHAQQHINPSNLTPACIPPHRPTRLHWLQNTNTPPQRPRTTRTTLPRKHHHHYG